GEEGMRPGGEAVQAAQLADEIMPRPQIKVIGVGQDDLSAQGLELALGHGLDRGPGADGHEAGGLDRAVRQVEASAPPSRAAGEQRKKSAGHAPVYRSGPAR